MLSRIEHVQEWKDRGTQDGIWEEHCASGELLPGLILILALHANSEGTWPFR